MLKKIIELNREEITKTPKIIRRFSLIFLLTAWFLFYNEFNKSALAFAFVSLVCHPLIFFQIRMMIESIKSMNSPEAEEIFKEIEIK